MSRILGAILATLAGIVVICGIGWFLLAAGIGHGLTRLSYDLPFVIWQHEDHAPPDLGIVIVYMSDSDAIRLQQRGAAWNRSLHAQLVRTLTAQQARAIFFDIVFAEPEQDPAQDPDLADAISKSGRVFLAAEMDRMLHTERVIPPLPMFRRVAAGWGLIAFRPYEEDGGVRYLYTGTEQVPSATWRLAKWLAAPLPESWEERQTERWINYYGAVDCFPHVPYSQALNPEELAVDYFKDKIVIVGGRASLPGLGRNRDKDEFRHPLTGWSWFEGRQKIRDNDFAQGAEVHATILGNLMHGEWLTRLGAQQEYGIIIGYGLLLAILLPRFGPLVASITAVTLLALLIAAVGVMFKAHVWWVWAIPAVVQTPVGLGWAIGSRYFLVDRRRNKMRNALTKYMSPHVVARLELDQMTLEPGAGTIEETTILFTDLEGFTSLSEELNDPKALSELLTWYFTRATTHVLENDGTILKYIGDSVFAVWGAPLRDSRHAQKAARAACLMHSSSAREIQGRKLRTRVGVHTGKVLFGNLGSLQQFDLTCIGDPVNLAARLESLNKHLGTSVLVSGETLSGIGDGFITRHLGHFQLAGKRTAIAVHELIAERTEMSVPAHLETFASALTAYCAGDFAKAAILFQETSARRGSQDGPSGFYLQRMAMLDHTAPQPWDPVIEMESK